MSDSCSTMFRNLNIAKSLSMFVVTSFLTGCVIAAVPYETNYSYYSPAAKDGWIRPRISATDTPGETIALPSGRLVMYVSYKINNITNDHIELEIEVPEDEILTIEEPYLFVRMNTGGEFIDKFKVEFRKIGSYMIEDSLEGGNRYIAKIDFLDPGDSFSVRLPVLVSQPNIKIDFSDITFTKKDKVLKKHFMMTL